MGFPSVDWNLNWPAEGSLTQANLQRFHFYGEELCVRGAVFPGSTMPPLLSPGPVACFSCSSPSQTRRSSSALKCVWVTNEPHTSSGLCAVNDYSQ